MKNEKGKRSERNLPPAPWCCLSLSLSLLASLSDALWHKLCSVCSLPPHLFPFSVILLSATDENSLGDDSGSVRGC